MGRIDLNRIWNLVRAHPAFLLIFGLVYIPFAATLAGVSLRFIGKEGWSAVLLHAAVASAAVAAYWLMVHFMEKRPFSDFAREGALRKWAQGLGLGFAAMLLSVGAMAAIGDYKISHFNALSAMLPMFGVAISSGVFEEIWTRGVLFRLIEKWLGSWVALAVSSIFFGAMHIGNPNANWLSATAIMVEAGILLAALYMVTRSLWAPIGLHMGWNFMQGGVLGVPVSGIDEGGLIDPEIHGNALITGGKFGAEASLLALVICTTMGLYFLYRAHKKGAFIHPSWHRFKAGEDAPPVD